MLRSVLQFHMDVPHTEYVMPDINQTMSAMSSFLLLACVMYW